MKSMIRFVMINNKNENFKFKEYTTELMDKVVSELSAKDVEFYSNKQRTRKCSLILKEKQYLVQFTFIMTHGTSQLKVDISREYDSEDDKELHDLKIKIKDLVIKEWEQCVWLEDRQSEKLAEDLYKDVHFVENSLRRLINTVLFYKLGGDWWDKYMPTQLTKKYKQRNDPYRNQAPSFKNIHTNLLSIDTGDLVTILSFKTYKVRGANIFRAEEPFEFTTGNNLSLLENIHDFKYILNNIMNDPKSVDGLQKDLVKILQNQMEVERDFWLDYFSNCFSCNLEEFQGKWENFSRDRNHVAHNKLIDHKLYQKFKRSMGDLLSLITEAESRFSDHLEQDMNNYIKELEETNEIEYRKKELEERQIKLEEAGVGIRDEEEIIALLQESTGIICDDIMYELYYRSNIEMTYNEPMFRNINEPMFRIVHNTIDSIITVNVGDQIINAEEDSTSNVQFNVYHNDKYQGGFEISYTNGGAVFCNEQGCYIPTTKDELHASEFERLKALIYFLVEVRMPEIEGEIASFPCVKCNNFTVNFSSDNEYSIGYCLSCSHENEVGECLRCEELLDHPHDGFCESCLIYIDSQ
ncbi:hypothetical protein FZD47_21105 [Bacillus infantis]|uniref:Apea-like HEPN domain-containing protein n=1 Tax=Bacillus infantis TaxID=324767 RepID=A0A5D4SCJ8_9BACI|nr:hypothetical protein [Bacillus infantis]TYS60709.1 hypothetical protein FZD47_21105 [Bacillus infantis]